ncbi:MAG: hypothetical protein AAF639_19925 [Chloroflexota bacterium]
MTQTKILSRREFVKLGLASTAGIALVACIAEGDSFGNGPDMAAGAGGVQLAPTPQCDDHDETPAQTAGPFYTPNTPERTSLREDGLPGTPLVVTGTVLTTTCQPIAGAMLDFWHTDDNGDYDNEGYRFRGHQFADANGNFRLETIMPGLYPGRTRHIHVRVQGEGTDLLTTQLYFPGDAENAGDSIFDAVLLMEMTSEGDTNAASFNFVLESTVEAQPNTEPPMSHVYLPIVSRF